MKNLLTTVLRTTLPRKTVPRTTVPLVAGRIGRLTAWVTPTLAVAVAVLLLLVTAVIGVTKVWPSFA